MSKQLKYLWLSLGIVIIWLFLGYLLSLVSFSDIFSILRNDGDFWIYFSGQGWLDKGHLLLDGGYAEYPPLALLYVLWPRFLTDNFEIYRWLLWGSNICLYLLVVWLILRLSKLFLIDFKPAWWLWLLPSVLYFSMNRFDVLPVVLVLLGIYLLLKGKWRLGWFIYGLAIITKLYPIFILPLFSEAGRSSKVIWWEKFIYVSTSIVTFTFAMIVAGGWQAGVYPYVLQSAREAEPGSIVYVLYVLWPSIWFIIKILSQLVQFCIPVWWLASHYITKIKFTLQIHIILTAVALLFLVGFQSFYSNQWWIWVVPFLVFVVPPGKRWLVVVYDLLNYLQTPICLEIFGKWSVEFNMVVLIRSVFLVILVVVVWRQLPRGWWRLGLLKSYV
jgi:hypothetical protein